MIDVTNTIEVSVRAKVTEDDLNPSYTFLASSTKAAGFATVRSPISLSKVPELHSDDNSDGTLVPSQSHGLDGGFLSLPVETPCVTAVKHLLSCSC